jgi:hypothetical protein
MAYSVVITSVPFRLGSMYCLAHPAGLTAGDSGGSPITVGRKATGQP